jgi:hypothetical protein
VKIAERASVVLATIASGLLGPVTSFRVGQPVRGGLVPSVHSSLLLAMLAIAAGKPCGVAGTPRHDVSVERIVTRADNVDQSWSLSVCFLGHVQLLRPGMSKPPSITSDGPFGAEALASCMADCTLLSEYRATTVSSSLKEFGGLISQINGKPASL